MQSPREIIDARQAMIRQEMRIYMQQKNLEASKELKIHREEVYTRDQQIDGLEKALHQKEKALERYEGEVAMLKLRLQQADEDTIERQVDE